MMDRRISKTQDAIKRAFLELMEEMSFEQITIQDISNKANIGRRTFYHHYLDKYDLLSKLIEDHINELRKICQTSAEMKSEPNQLDWFEYFEENYHFFSTMLNGNGASTFRPLFLEFVIEELKDFVDFTYGQNKGINPDIYFRFFGSAIVGVIESYFTDQNHPSSAELADQVMILLDRNM